MAIAQVPTRASPFPNNLRRKPLRSQTTTTVKPEPDDESSDTSDQCPEPYGFFADAEQCDKYYACRYILWVFKTR